MSIVEIIFYMMGSPYVMKVQKISGWLLDKSISSLGESVAYGIQGNSRHWQKRVGKM